MPVQVIEVPMPDLKDNNKALNIGTKLIKKIKSAPGAKNAHPVKLCFLLKVIFFDGLLKKTPSFDPLFTPTTFLKIKGEQLIKLFPLWLLPVIAGILLHIEVYSIGSCL